MNSTATKAFTKPQEACMAFVPQSSTTRGGDVIFITYSDDFPLPDGSDFFLVFDGSKQRHITTAQQLNIYTLRAIVPDHDKAEKVTLTAYCSKDDKLGPLSSHEFSYVFDTDQILAQALAEGVSNSKVLESLIPLGFVSNSIPKEQRDTLDARITTAFECLDLPSSWNVLEGKSGGNSDRNGQETLLHLAARLGFKQLATFLLDQPGANKALHTVDRQGKSPADIANEKGMKLLADVLLRGPGGCEPRTSKDSMKPRMKKSEIGTTTISSYRSETQNSIEKEVERLKDINSLMREEMKNRIPKSKHAWPVRSKVRSAAGEESSSDEEIQRINLSKKGALNSVSQSTGIPGNKRQLLEQNLKRLRGINDEIQRLRVVNAQRGSREAGRGAERRHLRRLSCPNFSGQDILQAHLLATGARDQEQKPTLNGTIGTEQKSSEATTPQSSRKTDNGSAQEPKGGRLGVASDQRPVSWTGDKKGPDTKPEPVRRISGSLDDLHVVHKLKDEEKRAGRHKDKFRSRTQVIGPMEKTNGEPNRLAEILDSIKKASNEQQGRSRSPLPQEGLLVPGSKKSGLQAKSYSYSCLADLKLDDQGNALPDGKESNDTEDRVNRPRSPTSMQRKISKGDSMISLADFLKDEESLDKTAQNRISLEEFLDENPGDSAEDSEEAEKAKEGDLGDRKGLRRLSMLFGGSSKSSKTSKREPPKQLSKTGRNSVRSSRAPSKDNKKDEREWKDLRGMGRRQSGIGSRLPKPGEQVAVLPNPGAMLARSQVSKNSLPVKSHYSKPASPLPFRRSSAEPEDDKGQTGSGVSPENSGDDEETEEMGMFPAEDLNDSDLEIKEEPEAWSVTIDKKTLKKMNAKDIKRQDVIHELIQTEVHHVRTLKIMQKIFSRGMREKLGMNPGTVNQMFPKLDELLKINGDFLSRLKATEGEDTIVSDVGSVLVEQFSEQRGKSMKDAYGVFCSKHTEAVDLYKKLLRSDKKFANYIKKCGLNKLCRRLSIPECITLVTQRLTKYPLLIEAIVKTTKESKPDFSSLKESISLAKEILQSVDQAITDSEKEKKLQDVKVKLDWKVTITYKNGKKLKTSDFAFNSSKLLHDGVFMWKTARGKLVECLVFVMEDMLVFLQEKDQKYTLLSLDQKAPVIRLKSLMVREVATDNKAIFLVSTSREGPEMYEIVCESVDSKKRWMKWIRDAAANAPVDDYEGVIIITEEDERRRIILRRAIALTEPQSIVGEETDRSKHLAEMQDLICRIDALEKSKMDGDKVKELKTARESLLSAAQQLQSMLHSEPSEDGFGENPGSTLSLPSGGPKRAETFSGFDSSRLKPDLKESVIRASSMKSERTAKVMNRVPGAVSPVVGSPKLKHRRKGSGGGGGGGGWSLLSKSSGSKDSGMEKSGSTGDLASSSASSSPANTPTPSPCPGQEAEHNDSDRLATVQSARFRPVKEGNPGHQDHEDQQQYKKLEMSLREQLPPMSKPQLSAKNEGDDSPSAPDVIYF